MNNRVHYKVHGADLRSQGQTDYEYNNQTACGRAGLPTTRIEKDVTCKVCLNLNTKVRRG